MHDFIYNQNQIPRQQYRYGLRASADTGCGWIAAYNALRLLGCRVEIPDLVREFTWQFPLIHGNAGTLFFAPALAFRRWGFPSRLYLRRQEFDAAAKSADACILFYRWHKGLRFGAHFVALEYKNNGFVGYNTYKNSTGPDAYGASLEGFLKSRQYFGAMLLTIQKKAKNNAPSGT